MFSFDSFALSSQTIIQQIFSVTMTYYFKINCLKFSSVAFFLLFFQVSFPQSNFSEIEDIISQKQKILGDEVVTMVANKDTIIYQKSLKIFTAKSQAQIGAASQWLTAALIMVLVDEGKLSLDTKVSQYLPEFVKYGKNYITIQHCLSHFTGIQSEPGSKALKIFDKKKFASLDELAASFAAKEIQTNPGTEFNYSSIGPVIAGRVAEIVTKKRFDLLIQQKLLRPLAMRQTTFSTLDASAINPTTGARSTANDFIHFLTMLLNKGTYKGVKVLSEASVKTLCTIQTEGGLLKGAPEQVKGFDYAMGAWAPEVNGNKEATLLVGPSFGGTLPVVDFCRGYAFLLLLKEETDNAKGNVYAAVKEVLDNRFKNKCQ
jgi:CubicO group peptidase (beta-lactamase class C family)